MRWCTCPDNDEVIVDEDFLMHTIRYSIEYFDIWIHYGDNYFTVYGVNRQLEELKSFFTRAYNFCQYHDTSDFCKYLEYRRDQLVLAYVDKINYLKEIFDDV